MEQQRLSALVNLIEFDRTLIAQEQLSATISSQLAHLERTIADRDQARQHAEKQIFNAKKSVHEHEQTMKNFELKEQEKRKLLDTIQSQKEYDALKKEITHLKKLQYDHEKMVVKSWKDLEVAQKEFDAHTTQFKEQTSLLNEQIAQKRDELQQVSALINQLRVQRTSLEPHVPEEWLAQYQRMRAQTTNPIVPLEYNSCSGCFSQLSAQNLLELKRNKLIQCNSCYRFIYDPAAKDAS